MNVLGRRKKCDQKSLTQGNRRLLKFALEIQI